MTAKCRRWTARLLGGGLLAGVLLSLGGCASKGNLHGKVTYRGEPLPAGTRLVFWHEKSDQTITADVKDDEGSYRVEGIPAGAVKVGVQGYQAPFIPMKGVAAAGGDKKGINFGPPPGTPDASGFKAGESAMSGVFDPKASKQKSVAVPAKYKEAKESPLTITVKGGNQEENLTLTD